MGLGRELLFEELSDAVLASAIEVHQQLGPGLLESTYEACLFHELTERNVEVQRQVALPVRYKNVVLDCGYRIDMLVGNQLIVEIKSIVDAAPIHIAQLMTYMRLAEKRVGLLINFNVRRLKDGITRRVL